MAASAQQTASQTNGVSPPPKPIQLSFPLPHALGTSIYLHLTVLTTSIMLFLTSASSDSGAMPAALGSFVYAMPDRYNPSQPLSTPLYTLPSSIDFTTRLAKVLARKTGRPVHVGSSISFASAGGGGSVEEEMAGFREIVAVVVDEVRKARNTFDG
ncbi:hypothetical protein LTR66_013369 [Elasticomyces elasticus]|nr:hypothetical protein LTR66_013369 [Elasticomyces elasticus]